MGKPQPKIIQYTNLLHQWRDPSAKKVREFLEQNSDDEVFLKRAKVLNKLFQLKQEVVVPT
jgi:hypothetical protein